MQRWENWFLAHSNVITQYGQFRSHRMVNALRDHAKRRSASGMPKQERGFPAHSEVTMIGWTPFHSHGMVNTSSRDQKTGLCVFGMQRQEKWFRVHLDVTMVE